jgi:nicotinic acid mononucleotide adenylyltransferase
MDLTLAEVEQAIQAMHAAPMRVVIEFAGAGAQALAWLHGVAGSSRTVLEATDRYAATSLVSAIGFEPAQFTSSEVAQALARRAYWRACHLAALDTPVVGIGCTATIVTDRIKRGDHRCWVAACDAQGLATYSLTLTKGIRTRQQEENLVSLLLLQAMADSCGVTGLPQPLLKAGESLVKQVETMDLLTRLWNGELEWVAAWPDGQLTTGKTWSGLALLSGAFNPLHEGHRHMAQVAAKILGRDVFFELPLINAAKGTIPIEEVRRRMAQFSGWATLILTRAPLFSQKAQLFPNSVFVLGVDTAVRLLQPHFYHDDPAEMEDAFQYIRRAGCGFLVAGRLKGDQFLTLRDIELPPQYQDLFQEILPEHFRIDISSTELREQLTTLAAQN